MKQTKKITGVTIGWREWLALPTLGIDNIKVKVDTGARTSAIHADFIEPFDNNGELYVKFSLTNNIGGDKQKMVCEAPVLDKRVITSSSGEKECRYVITTKIILGGITKDIELTLTSRSTMKFKMLLGRTALSKDFNVAPGKSYVMGRPD
ncbi:MAG: hypothetical protein ACJA1S_001694 [Cellvibrionaceae bacterium]|jgi:hypothetical protein